MNMIWYVKTPNNKPTSEDNINRHQKVVINRYYSFIY